METVKVTGKKGRRSKRFYLWVFILVLVAIAAGYVTRRYVDKGASSVKVTQGQDKTKGKKKTPRPLTAVAPPPPKVNVSAKEHPRERLQKMNLPDPPQKSVKSKLPKDVMDVKGPPQWTKPIAMPAVPKEAPDPFTAPAVKVNPARVPQPDVPRLSAGVPARPKRPKK